MGQILAFPPSRSDRFHPRARFAVRNFGTSAVPKIRCLWDALISHLDKQTQIEHARRCAVARSRLLSGIYLRCLGSAVTDVTCALTPPERNSSATPGPATPSNRKNSLLPCSHSVELCTHQRNPRLVVQGFALRILLFVGDEDFSTVQLTSAVRSFCNNDCEMDQTRHLGDLDSCRAAYDGTGRIA